MTPIYTRSACMTICIFKNTPPSFLVCKYTDKVERMWKQCVGGGGGEKQKKISVHLCVLVSVCHMYNTQTVYEARLELQNQYSTV